ncbi:MAG: hypothetical protein CMF29_08485 [Kiritimatiellaceae bacterium]|jgi:hypothetical protein|nr:hypothetical protein [Kiritimatiellaceae bacterium]|tara:strand:+ start:1789 stop:2013 length:225 start_codon:yes stop_codon:yes gene_type:complete
MPKWVVEARMVVHKMQNVQLVVEAEDGDAVRDTVREGISRDGVAFLEDSDFHVKPTSECVSGVDLINFEKVREA